MPDSLLRPAYAICWDRLTGIFREIAEIEDRPDASLREWEHLRRGPWALRRIRDAHPLGLPAGHRIWQVVLAAILEQPASAVSCLLGVVLIVLGRKKKPLIGYVRD